MRLFAEIVDGIVARVIVAENAEWCESRLGGEWIETSVDSEAEQYAGIGMGIDAEHPRRFAPEWSQPVPGQGDEGSGFPVGAYVWHGGRIWQSTAMNNVWEPGVFGWRDRTDTIPPWRQPAGAGDEWSLGDEVLHVGRHWKSLHASNVWEPGVAQWEDITETSPPDETQAWVQPAGAHDAYATGDLVTHGGFTWVSTVNANVWEPGVAGWIKE